MTLEPQFIEIKNLINQSRNKAMQQVNDTLISLYWQVGKYVSEKLKSAEWGDNAINQLSSYLKFQEPELKGFDWRNLYRMVKFYDTYTSKDVLSILQDKLKTETNQLDKFLSPLVTKISWSNHLIILSSCKTVEEKVFYLLMSSKERWSKRELERQVKACTFERTMLANQKMPQIIKNLPQDVTNIFRDSYVLEFLDLPDSHSEKDLRHGLIKNLRNFILECGKDFSFMGQEYRLQVGMQDFFIDLLFFHRELQCLIAIELKIESFKPADLGQINFYLEALDRDLKKSHENPSIGILLCKGKDDVVVEYALSRSLNPAMIADYQLKLPSKQLLHDKWQELLELSEKESSE